MLSFYSSPSCIVLLEVQFFLIHKAALVITDLLQETLDVALFLFVNVLADAFFLLLSRFQHHFGVVFTSIAVFPFGEVVLRNIALAHHFIIRIEVDNSRHFFRPCLTIRIQAFTSMLNTSLVGLVSFILEYVVFVGFLMGASVS